MRTGCYFTYRGPGRVSIARFAPRGMAAGYKVYKALAPGIWFNKVSHEEYVRRFEAEILAPLDPQKVWDEIHALVAPEEPVLLCWEKASDLGPEVPHAISIGKSHCHRRYVAEWFEKHLGVTVAEMEVDPAATASAPSRGAGRTSPQSSLNLICDICKTPMVRKNGKGYSCPRCGD